MTRIAIVDNEKLRDMQQKQHIQNICPVNRTGKECIKIEGDLLTIDEGLCTGCGICPKAAPEAIKIIKLPEELESIPVHRYGENKFVLYSLPTPLLGKVTGILGVNGIGKSTAIKIVAGVLSPNLGEWNSEGEEGFAKIINFFKGSEAQKFFEDLEKGRISVSYKPQQVELIPKTTKGTVEELLKKVDQKKQFEKIVEEFHLKEILQSNIDEISGGELQRVAIAATVLKKANLYVFDEPTSYLDIKQRINVSKFIRKLVEEDVGVLLVEHDLIILDYMTDLVNITYGKESCYGIFSGVKPTKAGINVYLSGFLKEENIRFRGSKIRFAEKPPLKKVKGEELTSWENISKKLGKFCLEANKGTVYKKDIIGILGENGTGKTTFVKILADVLKADGGRVKTKIKVSYKPQYIDSSDELVADVLGTAFQKYESQLINPLKIAPLSLRKMNELSGGELQRVAIVRCLQEDADLYLLDEPSAYLDAEQRLFLSKVMRDFMELKGKTAMIVDHDLLFIDYISNKIMVVDGKPALNGAVKGPFDMEEGMNMFLTDLSITLRRDHETNRPRVNKLGSRLDREQKEKKNYYYGG